LRSYGKVSPRFWTGESGRALRGKPNVQLVALYLVTAPGANMIGLFYLPLVIIVHETGLSETEVVGALDTLSRMGVAHYDRHQEIVFVPEMAKHQIAEQLKGGDKQRFGIGKELQPFLRHPFAQNFLARYWLAFNLDGVEGLKAPSDTPSEGLPRGIAMTSGAPPKPGSGSGSGTGTRAGEEPLPPSDEKKPDPPKDDLHRPKTAYGLLQLFGRRWEAHERKPFVKDSLDDRRARDIVEAITEIPEPSDRDRAFGDLPAAIERYFKTQKPFYAGHSFATFAKDLAALRSDGKAVLAPPPNPHCEFHQQPYSRGKRSSAPKESCPECRHVAVRARPPTSNEPVSAADLLAARGAP
jgi:hypothetical protein